ncbi:hypothetical protein HAX54_019712 [Datura stramonium]|uniref:Uncharacterized protein n=1 Tax=Datura stramonium TaxID=4076 RepID=A0ABS8UPN0_DATST|nr:hypothetical protein [Datura stramonium]
MEIPKQSFWMIRKIFTMRRYWQALSNINNLIQRDKFDMPSAYKILRDDVPNVTWSNIICQNVTEPKHKWQGDPRTGYIVEMGNAAVIYDIWIEVWDQRRLVYTCLGRAYGIFSE